MQNGRFRITLQRYEKSLKPPNIYGQNSPVSARFLAEFCLCQFRRENQRAETRLVDDDGPSLVVGTTHPNWEGGFVIIIYMLSQSRPSANGHSVSYIFSVHSTVAL